MAPESQDPADRPPAFPSRAARWRSTLEKNALWVSLLALLVAGSIVAVGIQVAPETFYDRFWWEDIWGPLVVDAHQCKTAATCPGIEGPAGIVVKDGYTVTSELTYGVVLAILLYGIYVGLFRRHRIVADGWFVLGLLPWIMLGPLARVLEDADVFCRAGTHCDPGPFAFVFISPVIYIQIALYVIGAILVGVELHKRRAGDAGKLTAVVGALLAGGVAVFAYLSLRHADWFSALPPVWFIALSAALAAGVFHWRARRGLASVNLTVFALGLPFAAGCLWLIGRWLRGGVWSEAAYNGQTYLQAGGFIFATAVLVSIGVWALARTLVVRGVEAKWARAASRVPAFVDKRLAYVGVALVLLALLAAGTVPRLAPFFSSLPDQETLIPGAALVGLVLLLAFAFLQVGRGAAQQPGALLVFALGINVALVFGHVMDGVATWVALEDPLGFGLPQYSEKHPFSEFLLRYWNGFLFPATKLAMVLVVAWLLDREVREGRGVTTGEGPLEAEPHAANADDRNLVGLVKMAIFVLGFAPGLRDLLRLSMGV